MSKIASGAMGLLGLEAGSFAAAPWSAAAIAATAAQPIAEAGMDFVGSLDLLGGKRQAEVEENRNRSDFLEMVRKREHRLKQLRMANLRQVAQYAPDVYHQTAAGRVLPKGAVVIGGQPRQDLLAELADAMSQGQITEGM